MAPPAVAAAGPLTAFIQSLGGVGASVAGSTIANLLPAVLQSTVGQGGVLRTQPGQQTSGTPSKFAITPQDTLAQFQDYRKALVLTEALNGLGFNLPPLPSFESFLQMQENRLERQMQGATDRAIAQERVRGELAALPATAQMAGTLGQSSNKVLESALSKVLASTGGMSPAVAEIAKVQLPGI
tara:strand:+ start:194 stop:745 length:552 start_codon:yes stop_codon:yes gene_type:complete